MPNYNSTLQTNNSSLGEIITQLNNLPDAGEGGIDTSDATAASGDILSGKTAYVDGEKITGNIPTVTQATPTVTINTATGLITATATQAAGYITGGTKTGTKQLAFQAAQTITPGTTNKTIAANTYLGGVQTIKGDANLKAENIVQGKSIFGVVGTATTGSDASEREYSLLTGTITAYTNNRVTTIGTYAFYNCSSLTFVNFPKVTTIGSLAFAGCSSLTSISFPKVTSIGSRAFHNCTGLTSISFPLVTTIDGNAFYNCTNLTSISFPLVTTIGSYAFRDCSSLTSVNFPKVTTIGSNTFRNCSSLTTIYLMNSVVCTLAHSNAFSNTGITSTTGHIFVPASLVTSYKSATNWTYFADRIFTD